RIVQSIAPAPTHDAKPHPERITLLPAYILPLGRLTAERLLRKPPVARAHATLADYFPQRAERPAFRREPNPREPHIVLVVGELQPRRGKVAARHREPPRSYVAAVRLTGEEGTARDVPLGS